MGFRLTPIEIAAIGAAGLAVLVVLIFIIYSFRRRRSSARKGSPKASPNRTREETPRGWGFGWTSSPSPSPPFSGYPPQGQGPTGSRTPGGSPASGQTKSPASGSTTLVTPTSSSSKLKKGGTSPLAGKKSPFSRTKNSKTKTKRKKGSTDIELAPPPAAVHRPESEEMVMVTYEQGLANMGMVRPHHILRYSEPPPFDQARQAYPVHTPESSANPTTGSSEMLTGRSGESGGSGPDRSRRDRDRARVEPQRTAGRRRRDDGQSTWLPSYYRSPESNRRRNLDDEESILGHRAGGGVDGRARYPGWI